MHTTECSAVLAYVALTQQKTLIVISNYSHDYHLRYCHMYMQLNFLRYASFSFYFCDECSDAIAFICL